MNDFTMTQLFDGHYIDWRRARIEAIVAHYGAEWFKGKTILELGCGWGHIGEYFAGLGAQVTFSDARPEYFEQIRTRLPGATCVEYDGETEWTLGSFDLILHMGLLYHLKKWRNNLSETLAHCKHLVLETEVVDSDDPAYEMEHFEGGFDQSIHGIGTFMAPVAVEQELTKGGFDFEIVTDARCNGGGHCYNWIASDSKTYRQGWRRFWFANASVVEPVDTLVLGTSANKVA